MNKKLIFTALLLVILVTGGSLVRIDQEKAYAVSVETEENSEETVEDTTTGEDEGLEDGTLIQTPGDPKVYVIKNNKRHWIRNAAEFNRLGYKWSDIKNVSLEDIDEIDEEDSDIEEDGGVTLMISSKDRKVYRLVNGKMIWVPTVAAFNAQGLKWEEVSEDDDAISQYAESRFIKDSEGNIYYITDSGRKRLIADIETYEAACGEIKNVVEVSDDILASIKDINLIRGEEDYKVYQVKNGIKRWIRTQERFQELGLSWDDVEIVDDTEVASYEEKEEGIVDEEDSTEETEETDTEEEAEEGTEENAV